MTTTASAHRFTGGRGERDQAERERAERDRAIRGSGQPGRLWRPGLVVVVGLVVIGLLARAVGGVAAAAHAVSTASPGWLLLTALVTSGSYLSAALVQHGAVSRAVALPRLVVIQLAGAFTNRLLPAGVGGMATNARGLRRAAIEPSRARGAVGAGAAVGVAMHVVTLVAAAPFVLAVPPVRRYLLTGHAVALGAPVVLLLLLLGILLYPPAPMRRLVWRLGLDRALLGQLASSRWDAMLLCGGSLGITTCHAVAFATSVHAVHLALPLPTLLALYVVAVAVAGLVPTPGGVGGVDAALVLALSVVGVAAGPAAAAVLVFRLLTFWLPILPGLAAFIWSLRRQWL